MNEEARARQEIEWQWRGMGDVILNMPSSTKPEDVATLYRHYCEAKAAHCYADLLRSIRFFYDALADVIAKQAAEIEQLKRPKKRTKNANAARRAGLVRKVRAVLFLAEDARLAGKTKTIAADEISHHPEMALNVSDIRTIIGMAYPGKAWKQKGLVATDTSEDIAEKIAGLRRARKAGKQ